MISLERPWNVWRERGQFSFEMKPTQKREITREQNNHAKHVRATKHYRTSLLLLIGRPKFMPHYIPHRSNILPRKLDDNENWRYNNSVNYPGMVESRTEQPRTNITGCLRVYGYPSSSTNRTGRGTRIEIPRCAKTAPSLSSAHKFHREQGRLQRSEKETDNETSIPSNIDSWLRLNHDWSPLLQRAC